MKKSLIIAGALVLLIAVVIALVGRSDPLQSRARRDWKQKSIAAISSHFADLTWRSSELARLTTRSATEPNGDGSWVSEDMILMRNGEWLVCANICRKEDPRIYDLFLARGSNGQWY